MKVNSNRDISFKNIYTNKAIKKTLEFAADNGTLFAATTTLGFSTLVRPFAIYNTPNVDKENKNTMCAKAIASAFTGFLLMLSLSLPFSKSIKKIDKNPEKYLKNETIKNINEQKENIKNSATYNFATQIFKLGLGLVAAIPKALITNATTPLVLDNIFDRKKSKKNTSQNITFKNKDFLAKGIGKSIDNKSFQEFSKKYKNSNFAMHISSLTDILTTTFFIAKTNQNKNLNKQEKNVLSKNALLSTLLCLISSYTVDKILDKPTHKFIENYRRINANDKNLIKQIEGIKIVKPMLILATIYYTIIPVLSTILTDKLITKQK